MTPNPAPDAVSDEMVEHIAYIIAKHGLTNLEMAYPAAREIAALSSSAPATEAQPKEDERVERVDVAVYLRTRARKEREFVAYAEANRDDWFAAMPIEVSVRALNRATVLENGKPSSRWSSG